MDSALKSKILSILDENRIMTVATNRPDGWPQATTVGYASEGFTLYFLCGLDSQKAANLARDERMSGTIDHDTPNIMAITGLSMAARAKRIEDSEEGERILKLLVGKYAGDAPVDLPMPSASDVALFRVEPQVISVLDYTKGFGHTDEVTREDLV